MTSAITSSLLPMVGLPGGPELIVILIVLLIIFGPKQLPKLGRAIGGGIKEFKDGLKTGAEDDEQEEQSAKTTVEAHPAEALPPGSSQTTQATEAEPAEKPQQSSQS